MSGVVDVAAVVLARSVRQSEIAAQNIANLATPAYKRRVYFEPLLGAAQGGAAQPASRDFAFGLEPGRLVETGVATDLAISGSGYFVLRDGERMLVSRQGRFEKDETGRLVDAAGHVLQSAGGGDLEIDGETFEVSASGVVMIGGEGRDRLAVVELDAAAQLRAVDGEAYVVEGETHSALEPIVRQGFIEMSNVSSGDEMIAMMAAIRRAEAGQRLVNVYDELLGRAATTFGQV